ncbi:MAG: mercuric transporter MerT family protein [Terriglobales bacterium]
MKDRSFVGASVVAAFVASLGCVLPIVFALGGFAVVGATAFFQSLRPYLLALTFGLLGAGFYLAYRKPEEACEPGSACARPTVSRFGRIGLWVATALVIAFAAFPYYSQYVADLLLPKKTAAAAAQPSDSAVQHVSFAVRGMYCPACAKSVETKLMALPGVRKAIVSYEQSTAEVEYDPAAVSVEQLRQAIADAGYRAERS